MIIEIEQDEDVVDNPYPQIGVEVVSKGTMVSKRYVDLIYYQHMGSVIQFLLSQVMCKPQSMFTEFSLGNISVVCCSHPYITWGLP